MIAETTINMSQTLRLLEAAGAEGLSLSSLIALLHLGQAEDKQMVSGKLAGICSVSTAAITGLVDRLEETGLAERVRGKKDRRLISAKLTKKGQLLVDKLVAAAETQEQADS